MRIAAIVIATGFAIAIAGCASGPRLDDRQRAFLGNAAQPSAIIATELALARESRERGTWAAVRRFAAEDAIWPRPDWRNIHQTLQTMPDAPPGIRWEPDQVVASCDGSYALSTGPVTYPNGQRMRYAVIWQRQRNGRYLWVLEHGFPLEPNHRSPDMIGATVSECGSRQPPSDIVRRSSAWHSEQSDDRSLRWTSELQADCSRTFVVQSRDVDGFREVFRRDAAPPPVAPGSPAPSCTA